MIRIWVKLIAVWAVATATPALAEREFGVYAGAGSFKYDVNGTVAAGGEAVELGDELNLGDEQRTIYYIELEHPWRWLPNLRADSMDLTLNNVSELGRDITFDGVSFVPPAGLDSRMRWEQQNVALYYPVWQSEDLELDLGLSVRQVSGELSIASTLDAATVEFDETLALLYGNVRFNLLSGWWFGGELHALEVDGNRVIDGTAKLAWESRWGVGAEFGYREIRVDLEDVGDVTAAEIHIEGPFMGLNVRF